MDEQRETEGGKRRKQHARRFPEERFASLRIVFGGRAMPEHLASAFRGELEGRGRKMRPGPLSVHVRSRRRISCLVGASGGAASYRGRFNFNLEKPRKPRGWARRGGLGEEVCAIPRFRLIAASGRPARLAHVRALQLSRLAAITVSDRRRLRSRKVNRRYCAQG